MQAPRLFQRRRASYRLRAAPARLDGRWLRHRPQVDPWAPHEQADAPFRSGASGLQLWPDYTDELSLVLGFSARF